MYFNFKMGLFLFQNEIYLPIYLLFLFYAALVIGKSLNWFWLEFLLFSIKLIQQSFFGSYIQEYMTNTETHQPFKI